jgi:hypothetical protein
MHRHPGLERQREQLWHHADQSGISLGQRHLAHADACTSANQRQLGKVAVASQRKLLTSQSLERLLGLAQIGRHLVVADGGMTVQLTDVARGTVAVQIVASGMQAELDPADAPRHQLLLFRCRHPHSDVRLAQQQVLHPIC